MKSTAKFFDACRSGIMGPTLDKCEAAGVNNILEAMDGLALSWTAYALATAWHETAHTMQPVKEYGGNGYFSRRYDPKGQNPRIAKALGNVQPGDGILFCGRGYVQLTGRANYTKAASKIDQALLANPDLALNPDIAAKIMRRGMQGGWFTGKHFADYLPVARPATKPEFVQARRIINGMDRAIAIAGYALQFQAALQAGEW